MDANIQVSYMSLSLLNQQTVSDVLLRINSLNALHEAIV